MPTPLTSNETSNMANTVYNEAIKARQMGVYLDDNPNDQEAAKKWHLIADSLFEAVALYDKMVAQGAKLPSQCTKQKTM